MTCMRWRNIILFAIILPLCLGGCKSRQGVVKEYASSERYNAMYAAIERMIVTHPMMSLCDVYKSCFQDYYGPAHAITDTARVVSYIEQELAQVATSGSNYYEPCGWRANYYRVDVALVADSIIPLDTYADAFMRSGNDLQSAVDEVWCAEWNELLTVTKDVISANGKIIPRMSPLILHFASDSAAIAQMLSAGNYVMHHSASYREHYHPHYRIIRNDIFQQEILPHIK